MSGAPAPWTFGVAPLAQTVELASLLRRVTGLALAMEQPEPAIDTLLARLREAEAALTARAPADLRPRIGADAPETRRVYLDHSRDIGAFNPCFPEYSLAVDGARAAGTVTFPLAFEGPPGVVHGGVQANFFDCVVQHHNCDIGVAGQTVSMHLDYRRPVPVDRSLHVEIVREANDRRITSRAVLRRGDDVLTEAVVDAVAFDRGALPPVSPRGGS
jgi:hypothetical protein